MGTWYEFVREIQAKHDISYREALQKASPLWKARHNYKKKLKKNKKLAKGIEAPEEITEFPKVQKRRNKKAAKPVSAVTNKSVLTPTNPPSRHNAKPSKKEKRATRKHVGPLLDSKFKYMYKKLYL